MSLALHCVDYILQLIFLCDFLISFQIKAVEMVVVVVVVEGKDSGGPLRLVA